MKIELGSGLRPHVGYITIDVESYSNPDIVGDFRTMSFSELDEIRSHHLLEHFSRDGALVVLKLWRSWLRVGGLLVIETPDFEEICKAFGERKSAKERYWLCRHVHGSQEANWAFHKDGWWEGKFRVTLPKLGFKIDSITRSVSRIYLPNITVTAIKA